MLMRQNYLSLDVGQALQQDTFHAKGLLQHFIRANPHQLHDTELEKPLRLSVTDAFLPSPSLSCFCCHFVGQFHNITQL